MSITNKCSCIICRAVSNNSAEMHSHFVIAHTENGKHKHYVGSVKGGKIYKNKMALIKQINEKKYYKNPKLCPHCHEIITYDKRHNKFCNSSCSCSHNNKNRITSNSTKMKISQFQINNPPPKRTNIKFLKCNWCHNTFLWNNITKGSKNFCSKQCLHFKRSKDGRNNKGLGTKRSKLEIELFDLCEKHYHKVTHNEKLVDGWDADIIIYDTKTAILWNGPWHYKEMNFGTHSLKQVQNRDKIKIKLFTNLGWNVEIFEDRHYTPKQAFSMLVSN